MFGTVDLLLFSILLLVVSNQFTYSMSSSNLSEVSRLVAISQYLSSLKSLQLVTPSIGLPYPRKVTEEKMIIHRALWEIQHLRLNKINSTISQLKTEHHISTDDIISTEVFKDLSKKLRYKVTFLKKKFHQVSISQQNINRKKQRNHSARERTK